jgi:Lar family restriction alleviation protein
LEAGGNAMIVKCPFCGNENQEEFVILPLILELSYVSCKCGASGPYVETEEEAVERWNKCGGQNE